MTIVTEIGRYRQTKWSRVPDGKPAFSPDKIHRPKGSFIEDLSDRSAASAKYAFQVQGAVFALGEKKIPRQARKDLVTYRDKVAEALLSATEPILLANKQANKKRREKCYTDWIAAHPEDIVLTKKEIRKRAKYKTISLKTGAIEDEYIHLARPHKTSGRPASRNLLHLFQRVDQVFQTNFLLRYRELITPQGEAGNHVRFLVDTALCFAQLIDAPTSKSTGYTKINNVIFYQEPGKPLTQFDEVAVRLPRGNEIPNDLNGILDQELDWLVKEGKSMFRVKYSVNPGALVKPRDEDVRFLKHQLGEVILFRLAQKNKRGHLPKELIFSYYRGAFGRKDLAVDVNPEFVEAWIDNELTPMLNDDEVSDADKDQALALIGWLDKEYRRLKVKTHHA